MCTNNPFIPSIRITVTTGSIRTEKSRITSIITSSSSSIERNGEMNVIRLNLELIDNDIVCIDEKGNIDTGTTAME